MSEPSLPMLPELTGDLISRMSDVGDGNLYAVRLRRDIKSRQGGTIAVKDTITWAINSMDGFVSIWTASFGSTVPVSAVERLDGVPEVTPDA